MSEVDWKTRAEQAEAEVSWFRDVIAEHLGYDAPAGDACNPLGERLQQLKQAEALVGRLRGYGGHTLNCQKHSLFPTRITGELVCGCGWDALLADPIGARLAEEQRALARLCDEKVKLEALVGRLRDHLMDAIVVFGLEGTKWREVCDQLLADPLGARLAEEQRQDREAIATLAMFAENELKHLSPSVVAAIERARREGQR